MPDRDVQADDGMSLRPGWQRGGRALFQLPESNKDQAAHVPPSRSSGPVDVRQPLWGRGGGVRLRLCPGPVREGEQAHCLVNMIPLPALTV